LGNFNVGEHSILCGKYRKVLEQGGLIGGQF
jgi:hypothetical protein